MERVNQVSHHSQSWDFDCDAGKVAAFAKIAAVLEQRLEDDAARLLDVAGYAVPPHTNRREHDANHVVHCNGDVGSIPLSVRHVRQRCRFGRRWVVGQCCDLLAGKHH